MTARIDFLRLASWDYESYPHTLSAIMLGWPGGWLQSSWLQYKGWRKEGFFIGHGAQNDRRHHIINVSGNLANKLYKSLMQREGWYATRLDVQITIPRPVGLALPEVHKRVGKIKSTLITSEKNDTLYLGTRTSPFFTRLYEKPMGDIYLRLEFELKSHRAADSYRALKTGRTPDEIFQYYLTKVKLPEDIKAHYVNVDEDVIGLSSRAETDSDNQKVLDWLRSLDRAMMRHMENHDIRDEVKEIVHSWANYAALIDIDEREC